MKDGKEPRIAYTVDEVAYLLGVGKSTVWAHLKNGGLTRIRFGGRTLIAADELRNLMKKCRVAN